MKVEFNTSKGEFAFVNLWTRKPKVKHLTEEFLYVSIFDYLLLELGQKKDFKLIGFVKELTEEQWSEVVDSRYVDFSNIPFYQYKDYKNKGKALKTAKESGKSLMNSLEVHLENPVEEPLSINYTPEFGIQKYPQECYHEDLHEYKKAERRTGSWLLIKYL